MIGIASSIVFGLATVNGAGADIADSIEAPPPDPSFCQNADLNFDGTVDENDLLSFVIAWCKRGSAADIDGDGAVGTSDIILFGQILEENLCD